MTTCSSSPRPDDSVIPTAPAAPGVPTSSPDLLTPPPVRPLPPEEPARGDPLRGLVHAAVADRPVEDVVRLITLLESSPEPVRTTSDVLRAVAVERSVEDVTRLVTLLTEPPRDRDSADEAIRAAAQRRPLEDVSRLVQLLHRGPVESSHCAEAAVRAVAVHRPVEELAELIGRLAAEREAGETEERPVAAAAAPAVVWEVGWSAPQEPAQAQRSSAEEPAQAQRSVAEKPEPAARPADAGPVRTRRLVVEGRPGAPRSGARGRAGRRQAVADRSVDDPSPTASVWATRCAALLVFLCGTAHAPRYWTGLSHGALGATLLASALCGLLALALTARAAPARLVAATAAVGVTVVLAAGHVLGGRFDLPDPARLRAATLAPSWLAGPTAAAAALGALAVLLTALTTGKDQPADPG
ncbi:hypothetical protein [Streptomyces argyrophylli]|uniref:hypothetical protein n=1 Tax=Streptomyces argyrophylli TaxID=2726118 RepID=UPI002017AB0E|nr:hypothetical protein [Streptomyces argyrophyllae]